MRGGGGGGGRGEDDRPSDDARPPPRSDDYYYAAERDAMMPHLTPLVWGCGCAFVTLSSLRFGRWYCGSGYGGYGGYGYNRYGRGYGGYYDTPGMEMARMRGAEEMRRRDSYGGRGYYGSGYYGNSYYGNGYNRYGSYY